LSEPTRKRSLDHPRAAEAARPRWLPLARLFLGIDIGTGGVRALAATESGAAAAAASAPLEPAVLAPQEGRHEQPPDAWWQATCRATAAVIDRLRAAGFAREQLAAVSLDGTSGTLVAVDAAGRPLRPAMMYNDPRAASEAEQLNVAAGEFCEKLGYRFAASYALAKIAWLRRHEPEVFARTARFVHQTDYAMGRLAGDFAVTDYSNALKTGYDLLDECWPAWIEDELGIMDRVPRVVPPGTPVGEVSRMAAAETGLPAGLPVVAGATDGTAAFLASGVCREGDYNATLGTTLVFKGLSRRLCRHPQGLVYCHKLPGGWWLPGAAGNVGCQWIAALFPGCDERAMDQAAANLLPTLGLAYPLVGTGERFPFLSATAQGFLPESADPIARFAACLQGTAMVERLGYEVLDNLTGASGGAV
jgi:D-ribulokinase